jgi:hypothetical protein
MRPLAGLLALALLSPLAAAGSETPPKGPPWIRDFAEAQSLAIREGRPIFVYLTKTY